MIGLRDGYWRVERAFGPAALRVHWSAPAPLLVLALGAGRAGLGMGALLAALVLVHEVGHLVAARRLGARVTALDLWALGGFCHYQGALSPVERSLVALAGPAANLAVTALGVAASRLPGASGPLPHLLSAAGFLSLGLAALNLLPVPPLDGREALALPWRWARTVRLRPRRRAVRRPRRWRVLP